MTKCLTPRVRRWLYGVTTAALCVLGVYGVLDGQQLAAWSGLAAAITGLALANTGDEPSES
ncbi:MAG: hypothetical protein E7L00_08495 [Propionibacteriaceae bacterium]|nr:hypothetical protein [Propionibacteriaceae bacterium]